MPSGDELPSESGVGSHAIGRCVPLSRKLLIHSINDVTSGPYVFFGILQGLGSYDHWTPSFIVRRFNSPEKDRFLQTLLSAILTEKGHPFFFLWVNTTATLGTRVSKASKATPKLVKLWSSFGDSGTQGTRRPTTEQKFRREGP